jgi:hypothetical protein
MIRLCGGAVLIAESVFFSRAPDLDIEVRWSMLKLCDVLVKPANEPIPKLRFPQQLVAEHGQPLPKIRLVNPAPERPRNLTFGESLSVFRMFCYYF